VANLQGVKTTAILSRMDNPIGNMIGNALEIAEVIECLHGGGPTPLVNLIEVLGEPSHCNLALPSLAYR
jgi:thymidine phosphorylase